jgi:hypothetical protein
MANQQKDPRANTDKGVEGEGSYTASRDYKKSIDSFMEEKSDKDIEHMARDAADALDSDEERPTLDKAVKQGLKHSKH